MIRILTWNLHGFVGRDGRRDVARTAAVLAELEPDVAVLQEVDARFVGGGEPHPLDRVAEALAASVVHGPTMGRSPRDFGNAVLSRLPVVGFHHHDLAVAGREPRRALEVELRAPGHELRLVAVHLGLTLTERIAQIERLLRALGDRPRRDQLVLAGDLNCWRPWSPALRRLEQAVGPATRLATFPSRWPMLRLDRILTDRPERIRAAGVARTPAVRRTSDHLPLWLDLD